MDELDGKLIDYLRKNVRFSGDREFAPSIEEYYSFLTDELKGEPLERFLTHLKSDPEAGKLVRECRQMLETQSGHKNEKVPPEWVASAKALFEKKTDLLCPHCGGSITPFKKPLTGQKTVNKLLLLAAAFSFVASFFIPRYFFQCLALGLFFGITWAVNVKKTKTQILIYKALSDGSGHTHSRDLQNPSGHL